MSQSRKKISDTNKSSYPRHCDVCPSRGHPFYDASEFVHHLRNTHLTREGGSFVCRYGPNGVCPSLPLEGVNDIDYEAHLRRFHTTTAPQPKARPSNDEKAFTMARHEFFESNHNNYK
ncbi:unnamed protein product, partial [Mesorhabditis belari]|uniref:Uncharacterized protein n=1 Tax=Mesorhabditis belari TaxID=2138241 RepID=A0AAF3FQI6_9BILA